MTVALSFLGAAGTVTGSRFLLQEEARAALARELEAWGWAVETPEFEESYLL